MVRVKIDVVGVHDMWEKWFWGFESVDVAISFIRNRGHFESFRSSKMEWHLNSSLAKYLQISVVKICEKFGRFQIWLVVKENGDVQ